MDNLTQQLDDTNDQLYMVRRELKHAESHVQELVYSERSEGPQPKTSSAFATELFPANERKPFISVMN